MSLRVRIKLWWWSMGLGTSDGQPGRWTIGLSTMRPSWTRISPCDARTCTVTTAADRILVDTNVLVYVSLRNFAWHAQVPATGTTLLMGSSLQANHIGPSP